MVVAAYGSLVLAALYVVASVGERQDPAAIRVAAIYAALAASAAMGAVRRVRETAVVSALSATAVIAFGMISQGSRGTWEHLWFVNVVILAAVFTAVAALGLVAASLAGRLRAR